MRLFLIGCRDCCLVVRVKPFFEGRLFFYFLTHLPLNPIQQYIGDFTFGESRQGVDVPGFVDEGDLVGVGLKADARCADVVGDNEIEVFPFQFFLGALNYVLGFGGKARHHLTGFDFCDFQ